MKRKRSLERGVILAMALIITAIILIICSAMTTMGVQQTGIASGRTTNTSAQNTAMAGLDEALNMLSVDDGWGAYTGGNAWKNEVLAGTVSGYESRNKLYKSPGTFVVTFDTTKPRYSTNNNDLTGPLTKAGWGGVTVPRGFVYVISTGTVLGQTQTVACMISKYYYVKGVNTKETLDGIKIHGWTPGNSDHNPDATSTPPQAGDAYANAGGAIGATVYGPAGNSNSNHTFPPQLFTPRTSFTGLTTYTSFNGHGGSSADPLPPGDYSTLSLGSQWLQPGKYNFDSIAGSAKIKAPSGTTPYTGSQVCEIFTNNDITLNGSDKFNDTSPADPDRVNIYGGANCQNITLNGQAHLFANVYAPAATIVLKGTGSPSDPNFAGQLLVKKADATGSHADIWNNPIGARYALPRPYMTGFCHL
jgi:hypothetical protein